MTKQYTITVTENQARIILNALSNEANDDMVVRGMYSYWRCYLDMGKKLAKAGYEESDGEQMDEETAELYISRGFFTRAEYEKMRKDKHE